MGKLVRKIMEVAVKGVDAENGVITFLGTTPTRDRWGEIVDPQGVVLDNYRKNPVFLWAHNYQVLPIGKSLAERVTPQGIEFDIKFDLADPFAQQVYRKYKDGFLRATSIGFIPLEWQDFEDSQGRGRIYKKWELLELSAVPVPANPDALQMALTKAADLGEFYRLLEEGGETGMEWLDVVEKGAVKFEATPKAPEDRPWDGDAAEQRLRKWASKDGSGEKETIDWGKYARGFLFVDTSDKENFGAYYFPHHDIVDGQFCVVWNGVRAAMAYLLKTYDREPVWASAKKAMYNHLVKHYEQFDKEPPEYKSVEEILFELAVGKLVPTGNVQFNSVDDVIWAYVSGELVSAEKAEREFALIIDRRNQTITVATPDLKPLGKVTVNEGFKEWFFGGLEQKAGAVLNRRNKEKLTQARDLIQEVLDSAEPAQENEEGKAASNEAASSMPAPESNTEQKPNLAETKELQQAIAEYAAQVAMAEVERLLGRFYKH
ncbi:phage prohead protease, HK97 family [Thermanaeromonas toyohensis ToBE]|uniref:Phage prohead protease, HK97 family n=1 Tax=Thermanaeromonas toyohensis ToBE TaxID=698762 RepID=A0A1W1VX69_9FIRM|nr:HK97 family phage prohead protease [Thermanaeromonas toyohensis]SMB97967.1 phage prohead protease, HK97 family [Thermanaeromonas toyohensis ToBE]